MPDTSSESPSSTSHTCKLRLRLFLTHRTCACGTPRKESALASTVVSIWYQRDQDGFRRKVLLRRSLMRTYFEKDHYRRDETSEKSSQNQTDLQHRALMSAPLRRSGVPRNIAKPLFWVALGLPGISVLIFTDLPLLY